MDDSTAQLLKLEAEISELTSRQDDRTSTGKETDADAQYIINPVTRKCHRALIHWGLPKFWKTRCSWSFGLTHYESRSSPVDGYKDLCDACLHQLRVDRNILATSRLPALGAVLQLIG